MHIEKTAHVQPLGRLMRRMHEFLRAAVTLLAMLSFSFCARSETAKSDCEFGRVAGYFHVGGIRVHEGPPILDESFLGNFIYDASNNERAFFTIGFDRSDGRVWGTAFAANGTPLHDYVATRGARCMGGVVSVTISGFDVTGSCFHRTQWDTRAYIDVDRSLVVARYQTDEYGRFCSKTSTMSVELTRYKQYMVAAE